MQVLVWGWWYEGSCVLEQSRGCCECRLYLPLRWGFWGTHSAQDLLWSFAPVFFFSWVGVVLHKHFGEAPASQMNREQSKGGAPLLSCYRVWGGKKVPHPDSPRAQLFPARFGCPSCPPSVSLTAASFLSYLLQIS